MADDLTISVRVQASDGWHELEDEDNGYTLHSDSLAAGTSPVRVVETDGDWIDGSFTRRATLGNVAETLAFWVEAEDHFTWLQRWEAAKEWFRQINYLVEVEIDNGKETWSCPRPGEFTWELSQPFRVAKRGLLRVQVYRLPQVTIEMV